MTTADVLRQAAQLLRTRGWIRGELHRDGGHCALGAMMACRADVTTIRTFAAALPSSQDYDYDEHRITSWNDMRCRTAAEVIAKLEAVAQQLEYTEGTTCYVPVAAEQAEQELELVGV